MNCTLKEYVERSKEILSSKNDTQKNKKIPDELNVQEYETMISFLEHAIDEVKKNYGVFMSEYEDSASRGFIKYDEEINQYYCNLGDIELRGNMGNIYEKNLLNSYDGIPHQIIECKYHNECPRILKQKYCKFYHDPKDLLILKGAGIISKDFYEKTIKYTRNFINTSWMYSSTYKGNNMRSFGSRVSLNHDILMLDLKKEKNSEIENFKAQIMHDILVLNYILS